MLTEAVPPEEIGIRDEIIPDPFEFRHLSLPISVSIGAYENATQPARGTGVLISPSSEFAVFGGCMPKTGMRPLRELGRIGYGADRERRMGHLKKRALRILPSEPVPLPSLR